MSEETDFFRGKRVLVTGGAGFVGSHFVEELLARGARVRVPIHRRPMRIQGPGIETQAADLTRKEDCLRVCKDMDYVVHAAGAVSAAGVTSSSPMEPITTNLVLSSLMLEAAWTTGVQRFLIFGSSTGYPAVDHPVKESELWSGDPHPAYFGYGWMRRYLERLGEFTHQRSRTRVAIIRPTAVYGRFDDFHPATSHVIPALIRRAVDRENPFVVWGAADVVRDFLHITDLIRGSLLVLEKHAHGDPVNIGYGEASTIGEIVQMILASAGHTRPNVQFDASKPTTIPFRMADVSKARALGFVRQISLADGLRDVVNWYQQQLRQAA